MTIKECQYCGKDITNNYMKLYCNMNCYNNRREEIHKVRYGEDITNF